MEDVRKPCSSTSPAWRRSYFDTALGDAKPAGYSYFVGCSTGGREGMILSQRFPTEFNGIVSGDPAMRTGLSNLAIGKWIPIAYNQASPKDASGAPQLDKFLTPDDRKLFMGALMKRCDARDGVTDGMISDPLGCDFDPASLACKPGQTKDCIAPDKTAAIKKAFALIPVSVEFVMRRSLSMQSARGYF